MYRDEDEKGIAKIMEVPTERQRKAVEYVKDGMSIKEAMLKAGYSEHSANQESVIRTDAWASLMDDFIPDKLLLDRHQSLLNKQETYRYFNKETNKLEVIRTGEIDVQAVTKGLDYAYKLKSKFPKEVAIQVNTQINLDEARSEFE